MSLHRTPVHHHALRMIQDELVVWRPASPPGPVPCRSAGFAHASGGRLDLHLLVALYELLRAKLIEKRGETTVAMTESGQQRLSEWDATRAVKR